QQTVAQSMGSNLRLQIPPLVRIGRGDAPRIELQFALSGAGLRETWMCAELARQVRGGAQAMEVDFFCNAARQCPRCLAVERQPQFEKDVLKSHDSEADRAPSQIRCPRRRDGIEIEVDDTIQLPHRQFDGLLKLLEVELAIVDVPCEIDGTQVAHRTLGVRSNLDDFSAEIR